MTGNSPIYSSIDSLSTLVSSGRDISRSRTWTLTLFPGIRYTGFICFSLEAWRDAKHLTVFHMVAKRACAISSRAYTLHSFGADCIFSASVLNGAGFDVLLGPRMTTSGVSTLLGNYSL